MTLKDDSSKRTDPTAQNQNQGTSLSGSGTTLNKMTSLVTSPFMENQVRTTHPVYLRSPPVININSNQTSARDSTTVKTWSQNIHKKRDAEETALTQRRMRTDPVPRTPELTALD